MMLSLLLSFSKHAALTSLLWYSSITGYNTAIAENTVSASIENSGETKNNNNATLKGIDVSRWQKEVDWMQVKESGVTFAFVKATQGDFRLDPFFARNWEETKRHGIKRGAYHFFKPEAPVQDQITLFTSTVTLAPGDLPPVLDVEISDPRMTGEQLRTSIKTWLEAVTKHYGVKPIIYTSQNYYRRWLQGHFSDYHFWIARYSPVKPEVHHTDSWMFWQYTDSGSVSGINSAVDINFFAGNMDKLSELCIPEYATATEQISPLQQLKHKYPQP
ncbi:lysozyme [Pontibacter sp. KCTC 32443]|uniref:glycoside hydrolase family 25 protein n=1 Tax=Pontibacter TaxID=323449 RepID=UPI00164D2700|nr:MULTISPECIES: GH25 family lysozyme [Pontibacter]MBC5774531.1 lysozyme [Pontibacter sp. KCTC 32443]